MSVTNETAKFGACPYDDGSGYRFEVVAEQNNGVPRLWIKQYSDTAILMETHEWPSLRLAIERGLLFLDALPEPPK